MPACKKLLSPRRFLSTTTMLITLSSSTQIWAQTVSPEETPEISAIFACQTETDAMKRLACYDEAVGRFETANEQGEVVTISKQQVEAVKKDSFGFNIPSLPKLGSLFGGKKTAKAQSESKLTAPAVVQNDPKPKAKKAKTKPRKSEAIASAEIKEITIDIKKVQEFGYKKLRVFLVNGQVWEQTDSTRIKLPRSRKSDIGSATVRRAALGSYLMQINGKGKAFRVKRVR